MRGIIIVALLAALAPALNADICQLPKEVGPCRASNPRFHYDSKSGSCQKFNYGGCNGNANNFETLKECENKCKNKQTLKEKRDKSKDICSLPKDQGNPARASVSNKFYYNSESKKCEEFKFYGGGGNKNNFPTKQECINKCHGKDKGMNHDKNKGKINDKDHVKQNEDICSLPKQSGPCRAAFNRYFFNSNTRACEKFTYGGCQANKNNFQTKELCEKRCNPNAKKTGGIDKNSNKSKDSICFLPKNNGCQHRAVGASKKFYYNAKTGSCEEFYYVDCSTNDIGNRFNTEKECYQKCGK